jgi:hypothetical protein
VAHQEPGILPSLPELTSPLAAADGFKFRGKALKVEPGGSARLEIRRRNIAERLYRATGGGIDRDSVMLGRPARIREPLLAAQTSGAVA